MRRLSLLPFGRSLAPVAILALAALLVSAPVVLAGEIVDHPEKLKFKELKYQPPKPDDYRHTLKCGAAAYLAENPEVPTFDLKILVRTGSIYEPLETAGLADMTGYLMRNGGVEGMTAKELDERLAYLAGEISVKIDDDKGTVSLFCLSKDIDKGLELLKKVLRSPVFDAEALDRYRTDLLSEMEQRNASTSAIEKREWQFLTYGDHPCTTPHRRTERSVNSITREDMIAFHKKYFFPQNFVFAVSGDFKTADILAKLDGMLSGWPDQELSLPAISDQIPDPQPGVYMIKKEEVNQSRIRVGHVGVKRDIPDEYALVVMNDILGGRSFTSRIKRRVRSDEGLAYSTGSTFERRVLYPGTFEAWLQTKHATGAFGARLIVDEIKRIRSEKCEADIVDNSKASFISNLVNPFSSKNRIVNTLAEDDYTGRPDDYWQSYAKNMEAVTPDDVLAAAQKYLHPDKLVFLVVGDPEAVQKGSDKHDERFSDFGEITILPLRDPMTLEMK
ncbi:MAG: insulinase family protein [Candidatus Zixiibacteriota bacterium]|nr:MAG: insulinase family protein [candidate division Zixibacteria bacterium]